MALASYGSRSIARDSNLTYDQAATPDPTHPREAAGAGPNLPDRPGDSPRASGRSRQQRRLPGYQVFLILVLGTAVATLLGFLGNGATQISAIAGWGLVASSIAAALLVGPRDRHVAIWGPPLAMAVVVLVLGQFTLIGSGFSLTRELSLFLSAMSSAAPAQLISVLTAFAITFWRFRPGRKPPAEE